MTLDIGKIRHHAKRAPQPGPWTVEKQGDSWVVLDANGCWVCDVGEDELDARHIAACDPQSIVALVDRIDTLANLVAEACNEIEDTGGEFAAKAAARLRKAAGQ